MSPARQPSSGFFNRPNWNLIFTICAFVMGYTINGITSYLQYTNKVDNLSAQVKEVTTSVQELSKSLDQRHEKSAERYSALRSRVSILEVKIFGHSSEVQAPTPAFSALALNK